MTFVTIVNLRASFWFNGGQYEGLKLKSSLIRLVKRALDEGGVSMPDEAREVIFPLGVPVFTPPDHVAEPVPPGQEARKSREAGNPPDPISTKAEGDLRNEDEQLRQQAQQSRVPEEGENLLEQ